MMYLAIRENLRSVSVDTPPRMDRSEAEPRARGPETRPSRREAEAKACPTRA